MITQPIIVTGANGFVGSEVIRSLYEEFASGLGQTVGQIICVVRPRFGLAPAQRMEQVFSRWLKAGVVNNTGDDACFAAFLQQITCVDWAELPAILSRCAAARVIHAAADTAFDLPLAESRRINVGLTDDLLKMLEAANAARLDCVERLLHVSTAFVAGKAIGRILEHPVNGMASSPSSVSAGQFHNAYEQSKYESELLVSASDVPWTIVRPAIVVGDSRTGFTLHFRVIYSVIRLWLRDVVPRAPLDRRARVDLVPSDHVARVLLGLARLPQDQVRGQTVHVCSGDAAPGPVDIMMAASRAFVRPPLPLSPPWVLRLLLTRPVMRLCSHQMREILRTVAWHMPYLGSRKRVFDNSRLRELLGSDVGSTPKFSEYGDRLFEYCAKTSWGRKCSNWT